MTRTLFAAAILGLTLTLGGHPSVRSADKTADAKQPNYVHTVIFYLKKDAPKEEGQALIDDAFALLSKIPSVKGIRAGLPAGKATTPNEKDPQVIVPKDYQVGLLVLFDNFDGLQTYIDHPLHVKYVDKHLKHVEKVMVYDFVQADK